MRDVLYRIVELLSSPHWSTTRWITQGCPYISFLSGANVAPTSREHVTILGGLMGHAEGNGGFERFARQQVGGTAEDAEHNHVEAAIFPGRSVGIIFTGELLRDEGRGHLVDIEGLLDS